jgi:DNA-binding NarL/FixJ family response regulator
MRKKTIVIVEDNESQRLALQGDLERRQFKVRSAATAAEAREVIDELGEEIDVMVLDMLLEPPSEINTTGADLGIEVQNKHPHWLPEFLIHSAFNFVNYYKLALQLGAAAYLSKAETSRDDVIRHVRALALKRALRLERSEVTEKLRLISESTKNLSAAVRRFCQDVLADELDACLGSPYVLLLTDESGTQNFATNTSLPQGYEPVYMVLQAMAHGISNFSSPYEVSEQSLKHLPQPSTKSEVEIYKRLPRSAFIPLANVKNFRLSLGLFEPLPGEVKYPEETGKLATVLAQYVRSTIVEHFLRILVHLDSQKRAMLKSTGHLCLFLGQDQQRVLEEGVANGQFQPDSGSYRTLVTMADDLWETGVILGNVANSDPKEKYSSLEMRELIERVGAELDERIFLGDLKVTVEGSCRVKARRDDMYVAIIRVMQWLAQRRMETSPEIEPAINVSCRDDNIFSVINFEDRSVRLPEKLREQLFQPFSVSVIRPSETKLRGPGLYLPLFLAKMLVEEKYGGWLDDRSDELEGDIGHRLVMRFDSVFKTDQIDVAYRSS